MSNNSARVIIATGNKGKLKEIKQILKDYPIEVYGKNELGIDIEVEEDGETFEDNAVKKARAIMELTGYTVISDDSGLEVEVLDNEPGIYSSRFASSNATDNENNEKLLKLMEGIPFNKRKASFICVIALVLPSGKTVTFKGECSGYISQKPAGENGFGYDPLFLVPEYKNTFGQLDEEIKNRISHRAKALEKLKLFLNENWVRGFFDEDTCG